MQIQAAKTALVSSLVLGAQGFQPRTGIRPAPMQGVPLQVSRDRVQVRRSVKPLMVQCKITNQEADLLARNALQGEPLPNRDELFARVKTPDDIYRSGVSTAQVLMAMNAGLPEEEARRNNLKALFLRDKFGQCVVNETLKTWGDKLNCLAGIVRDLPQEMKRAKIKPLAPGDEPPKPLSRQEARQLAQSFLLKKPLKNRDDLMARITNYNDMVRVDGEAIRLLETMNQGLTEEKARRNNMNYLFMMHHLGMQVTGHMIQSPEEHKMYRQHLMEVFRPW